MNRLQRIARTILAALPYSVIKKLAEKYAIHPIEVQVYEDSLRRSGVRNPDTVTEWVLQLRQRHSIRGQEDFPRVVEAANFFFANSGTPRFREVAARHGFLPQDPRNLFSYELRYLETIEDEISETPDSAVERQRLNKLDALPEGAALIYNANGLQIARADSAAAACQLARGTKWCTSNENTANYYLRQAPLYIIYERGKKVMQMHVGNDGFQLMDLQDNPVPVDRALFHALEDLELTDEIFQTLMKHPNFDSDGIRMFQSFWNNFSSEVQQELKKTTAVYSDLAITFARYTERRFPEGEATIAKDAWDSLMYARTVVHGRFVPGEPAIFRDARTLREYGRFLDNLPGDEWKSFERDYSTNPMYQHYFG